MKLGETKTVTVTLSYSQAHKLIGLKWIDYIKHLIIGVTNGRSD